MYSSRPQKRFTRAMLLNRALNKASRMAQWLTRILLEVARVVDYSVTNSLVYLEVVRVDIDLLYKLKNGVRSFLLYVFHPPSASLTKVYFGGHSWTSRVLAEDTILHQIL